MEYAASRLNTSFPQTSCPWGIPINDAYWPPELSTEHTC